MTQEHLDTLSRLASDRSYWDGLAERIRDESAPVLMEYRAAGSWWSPVARFAPLLAAAAVLVLIVGWIAIPQRAASAPGSVAVLSMEAVVTPSDPLGQAVFRQQEPPSFDQLFSSDPERVP